MLSTAATYVGLFVLGKMALGMVMSFLQMVLRPPRKVWAPLPPGPPRAATASPRRRGQRARRPFPHTARAW